MAGYWIEIFKLVDGKPGPFVGHFTLEGGAVTIPAPPSPVEQFIAARTEPAEGAWLGAGELYAAFCAWGETQRIEPISAKAFGSQMAALGHKSEKHGKACRFHYKNIKLLPPEDHGALIEAAKVFVAGKGGKTES